MMIAKPDRDGCYPAVSQKPVPKYFGCRRWNSEVWQEEVPKDAMTAPQSARKSAPYR